MSNPLFKTPPESICIIRLSAIGDVCHVAAVVEQIKAHWPKTKITWITGKAEYTLLQGLDGVEFIVFDKKDGRNGMAQIGEQLVKRKFDVLLHMQLSIRSSLLSRKIRAKYKVGFNMQRAREGQWFFTNKKIPDTSSKHVLDSFLSFSEFIGVPRKDPKWPKLFTQEHDDFTKKWINDKPVVVIAPCASNAERNWLIENYAQFANYAIQKGYKVILCGGVNEEEKNIAQRIVFQSSPEVTNLVGQTNLKQLAALINKATCVLAPDSGPAHIATTQNTPVIGLYAHSNPLRTGPYFSQKYVVNAYDLLAEEQYGKPVSELEWGTRVKGYACMREVKFEMVIEKFEQLIADLKR